MIDDNIGGKKVVYPVRSKIIEITWRVIIHSPKVDHRNVKFLPARELIALRLVASYFTDRYNVPAL